MLTSLDNLATGFHEVTYAVVLDDDDYVTLEQWEHWKKSGMLPQNVREFVGARTKTLNARMNDAYAQCPADIYSQVADDCFPLTHRWDLIFYGCRTLPAFCWTEMNDPENATFLVVSKKWYDITGRYTTERFPFWFADTWLGEVYRLAFGMPISAIEQLGMGGKRGETQGMRDVAFWFRYFAATRCERIEEAQKVADAYGLALTVERERQEEIALMEKGDAYQLTQVPRYEAAFKANLGAPSQVYLDAKAAAEAWLAERALLEAA